MNVLAVRMLVPQPHVRHRSELMLCSCSAGTVGVLPQAGCASHAPSSACPCHMKDCLASLWLPTGMWEFKRQNTFGAAAFTSCERSTAVAFMAVRCAALLLLRALHSRLCSPCAAAVIILDEHTTCDTILAHFCLAHSCLRSRFHVCSGTFRTIPLLSQFAPTPLQMAPSGWALPCCRSWWPPRWARGSRYRRLYLASPQHAAELCAGARCMPPKRGALVSQQTPCPARPSLCQAAWRRTVPVLAVGHGSMPPPPPCPADLHCGAQRRRACP